MTTMQTGEAMPEGGGTALSSEEVRVLGCLMEKARTTPDDYPLSRNALTRACNQSTNRSPIVLYDESTVAAALDSLKERRLVRFVHMASGRGVTKYRHVVDETWGLDERQSALVCLLALRGPQTLGELKTRSERLADFPSLESVAVAAEALAERGEPLVLRLERRPGQKEARWTHLLLGAPLGDAHLDGSGAVESTQPVAGPTSTERSGGADLEARVAALEARVAGVEARLHQVLDALGEESDLPD